MKFLLFWNKCKKCGERFDTLSDPGLYSSRLLLSEKEHQPAIVKCDEDPAFTEIYQILTKILKPKGFTTIHIANLFDQVFGDVCDPAPDGSRYNMSGKRKCPRCASDDIDFGPYDPEIYTEESPPEATHKHWDLLKDSEKHREIERLLDRWSH